MSEGPGGGGADAGAPFGIYVHIPFCLRRCDYCAYATWDDRPQLLEAYLEGLGAEIGQAVGAGLPEATSVFLGGGTPSVLAPYQVEEILAPLPLRPGAEVSLECNPETADRPRLTGYRRAGINRVSLGAQSLVPHVLVALGRTHDVPSVELAARAVAETGFVSWSMDLVYGTVGESLGDWERTLALALALGPPHVSAYGLTTEPGTPLAAEPARHPDDDDQADKYLAADDALAGAGLASYEVSNWARPGHECRQSLCYWSGGEYRGFGCAAHSHGRGRRWWNVRSPERYLSRLAAGHSVEAGGERLSPEAGELEALQLALPTRVGVPAGALDAEGLESLVTRRDDRWVLTPRGRLLADEVALRLRVAQPAGSASGSRRTTRQ